MDLVIILVKVTMGFIALLICLKVTGAKGISNLTPIDFIWSIMLSEMVGNGLYDNKVKWYYILSALAVWCVIKIAFDYVMYRSDKAEKVIIGDKTLIIDKGKVDLSKLKKNKIDLKQLQESIRKNGVFSLEEIDRAYIETDGTITVKKKRGDETVKRNDLKL